MGSFAEALRLLRHADNDLFPEVRQLFNVLFTNNGVGISKFAEEWSKVGREQQKNLLHYVIQLMEHTIKAKYSPHSPIPLPDVEADFVRRLAAKNLSLDATSKFIASISETIYFIERNAHSKTQLHALLIRLQFIILGRPLP
jgi:DNA polymerase III subunit delta'